MKSTVNQSSWYEPIDKRDFNHCLRWVLCIRCLPCPCMCLEEPLLSLFHQAALWRSPVCPPDRSLRSNASQSTGESESPSYSAKNNWTCHNPEEPEGCLKFEHEKLVHEFDLFWISIQKEHAPYSTCQTGHYISMQFCLLPISLQCSIQKFTHWVQFLWLESQRINPRTERAIQSQLTMFPSIEQLKSEQKECIRHFIVGKDAMSLLPTELITANTIYSRFNWAGTLHTSQPNISDWVNSDSIHTSSKPSSLNSQGFRPGTESCNF